MCPGKAVIQWKPILTWLEIQHGIAPPVVPKSNPILRNTTFYAEWYKHRNLQNKVLGFLLEGFTGVVPLTRAACTSVVALIGYIAPNSQSVIICDGPKVVLTHSADYCGGYVSAWKGIAIVDHNWIGAVNLKGYKKLVDISWLRNDLRNNILSIAVDNSGKFLAGLADDARELDVWSLKSRKLTRRINVHELRLRGLQVSNLETYNASIIFSPSGNIVYATFPSADEPDSGGYVEPITVAINLTTGKARPIGLGTPVGFDNTRLVQFRQSDIVYFETGGLKLHPRGGTFSSLGRRFVVAEMKDKHIAVDERFFPNSRTSAYYEIPISPRKFTLFGVCLLADCVTAKLPEEPSMQKH